MAIEVDRLLRAYTMVGNIKVRALSELDVRERERISRDVSREYADVLRDESSEEYQEHIAPLLEMSEEEMRESIMAVRMAEFVRDANDEFPYSFVPFPDDATLEEQHEVLRERERVEQATNDRRAAAVANRIATLEDKLSTWSRDALSTEMRHRAIASLTMAHYADAWQYMTLKLACFKEDGSPYFDSHIDVQKMAAKVVAQLFAAYREVDAVDPWELEKNALTGPTQDG